MSQTKTHGQTMAILTRTNGLAPEHMTAAERMAELGQILALGALRMSKKSSAISGNHPQSLVDFANGQSGSASRSKGRNA
jgi:hypothetical protein